MSLYKSTLKEYKPTDHNCRSFVLTSKSGKSLYLRAKSDAEMHEYLNTILRQKVIAEDAINPILEQESNAGSVNKSMSN